MQLAELWPYALILVSGAALTVTVFLLLVQPRGAPPRPAPRRTRRGTGARPEPPAEPLHKPANDRRRATLPATASEGRAAAAAAPIGARPAASLTRASTQAPAARSMEPRTAPLVSPAPMRAAGAGDFVAAAQGAEPAGPLPGGNFEIPSFLRRNVDRAVAGPVSGLPPEVGEPEPHVLRSGLGRLFYDPPATMRALEPQIVTVRVLRDPGSARPVPPAFPGLRGFASPGPEEETGDISMSVQMSGAEALQVEPRSPPLQLLGPRHSAAEWAFKLTPLRSGSHRLELAIAASRPIGGKIEVEELDIVTVKIDVRANGRHLAGRALRLAAAAIAVALLTWLVTIGSTASG